MYPYHNQYQVWSTMRPPNLYPNAHNSNAQFSTQNAQPYAPSHAAPTTTNHLKPLVTGYLHRHAKATDNYRGAQLQEVLKRLNINMEAAPPFETVTANASYSSHGVIKINNIPFTVTGQEITQFIGRFANTPMIKKNLEGFPVHIIMEKPTGKTMDCFVEFPSREAARDCVKRFEFTAQPGRGTKIGNRSVSLDLSHQAELMKAVFPRARLVKFEESTGQPHIMSHEEDPSWSAGFRGYFTLEEIYGIIRFSETPSRSPFVLKCNQRVYESLISTLYKFPWAATQTYTVAARNALCEAAYRQLSVLSKKVGTITPSSSRDIIRNDQGHNQVYPQSGNAYSQFSSHHNGPAHDQREVGLSQTLLFDLLFAALNVPAFSLYQKFGLCQVAGPIGRGVPLSHFAQTWPFQTIVPGENVSDKVIQFWLQLFDSGFDLITGDGTRTTYEHYLNVNRSELGFPIAQWTRAGTELPFEDAVRIEIGVMMVYINRGRACWAEERGLIVNKWQNSSLMDLMQTIAREKEVGRRFEPGEPRSCDNYDSNVSPTTTEFDHQVLGVIDHGRSTTVTPTAISQLDPIELTSTTNPGLNPATAKDFIPASKRNKGSTENATNNVYSAFKSIWSDPPIGAAQSSQMKNPTIVTSPAKTAAAPIGSSLNMPSGRRAITAFRDPFGPPSSQAKGFDRAALLDYKRTATGALQEAVDPFQQDQAIDSSSTDLASPHYTTRDRANYSLRSPYSQRESTVSIADSMRYLSLDTASRNTSTDNTCTSISTPNDTITAPTSASSYRNPSFAIDRHGSPTSRLVQKYPDVTYSTVGQGYNTQQVNLGQYDPRSNSEAVTSQDRTMSAAAFSRSPLPLPPSSSADKVRAQSTPFTAFGYRETSGVRTHLGEFDKRDSLPVTTPATSAEFGSTTVTHSTAGRAGLDTTVSQGKLNAEELWSQVRGFK